jgi:F-type H+-transporting ATPase subunit b
MLELDIPTIIFEIINFLALSLLLYFLLFRRVMQRVRERAQEKERIMQETREERKEAQRIREDLETRLENVGEEVSSILAEAQEELEGERRNIIQSAKIEAERILNEARSEADQIQHKAMEDFREEIFQTVTDTSGYMIRNTAPAEIHDHLVANLNERIWELGRKEMDRVETIRRSLDERSATVTVETAKELSVDQQRELAKTLSALVDRDIDLDIKHDPDLILGLKMRVGDTIITNSIASELDTIQDEAYALFTEGLPHE